MSTRSHESVINEIYYWKTVNNDLRSLLDFVVNAATYLASTGGDLLIALSTDRDHQVQALARVSTSVNKTMTVLKDLQDNISQIGEIVGGRLAAIEAEMNGDEAERDE